MTLGIVILFLFLLVLVLSYNRITRAKNRANSALDSLKITLNKRRTDLVPILIESGKINIPNDSALNELVDSQGNYNEAQPYTTYTKEEEEFSKILNNVMEKLNTCSSFQSSAQFDLIHRSWNEFEEQISASKRAYSICVTNFNNSIERFPGNLIAALKGLKKEDLPI